MKTCGSIIWFVAIVALPSLATNYDEAKVGNYTLPDPLICKTAGSDKRGNLVETRRGRKFWNRIAAKILAAARSRHQRHFQRLGNFHQRARRHGRAASRLKSISPARPTARSRTAALHARRKNFRADVSVPAIQWQLHGRLMIRPSPFFRSGTGKRRAGDAEKSSARRIRAELENFRNTRARLRHRDHWITSEIEPDLPHGARLQVWRA